jgi:nitroreductase
MMLAAYALGLGSCWVGFGAMVREDDEVRKILELQEDERIFGPVLLGYPKGYPERPPKREPRIKWI